MKRRDSATSRKYEENRNQLCYFHVHSNIKRGRKKHIFMMKVFSRAILTALATSKPIPTSGFGFTFSNKVYYSNSELIMMKHIEKFSTRLFSAASTADLDDLTVTLDGPDLPSIASGSKRLFLVRHGEGEYLI